MEKARRLKGKAAARTLTGMAALLLSLCVIAYLAAMSAISLANRGGTYWYTGEKRGIAATAPPINQRGVNLNTASLEELMSLPGIGEYLAEQLILARETRPFHFIEDLGAVKGFGERRINAIRHLAFVPLPEAYKDGE